MTSVLRSLLNTIGVPPRTAQTLRTGCPAPGRRCPYFETVQYFTSVPRAVAKARRRVVRRWREDRRPGRAVVPAQRRILFLLSDCHETHAWRRLPSESPRAYDREDRSVTSTAP